MKYGQLEIPEKLIKAQEEGNLVIFAGAGVSMGNPCKLPDFEKLVKQVCCVLPYEDSEPLETVLGRHSDAGIDVHLLTRIIFKKHMNREGDLTTEQHKNIPRLFKRGDSSSIRVVTTNFDTYLSKTISDSVKRYSAPALPLSSEFSGLVYLHGSIDDNNSLVLTDCDFAKAYMTEGWAREFILNLYEKYSILFIGYSHEDLLVSYLARGMNLRSKRVYALTGDSKDELEKWDHLGITPITYPHKNYGALQKGVKKWADEVQSNFFSRKKRFNSILQFGLPIQGSENDGFLKKYLMTPGITGDFTRKVDSSEWCSWVVESGQADFIHNEITSIDGFSALSPWDESEYHLGHWLAKQFVSDVRELNRALKRHGHGISWPLAQALIKAICSEKNISETSLGYLCTLLLTECSHVMVRNYHTELLSVCLKNGAYQAALLVFRELIKPKVGMDFYYPDSEEGSSLEIGYFELNFTAQMLLEFCFEKDKKFIKTCSREIFDICINALQSVEEMNQGAMTRIPYSRIEVKSVKYSGDLYRTPLAGICCIAVECLEYMLDNNLIPNPISYATYLVGSKSPIVRRIAIHLVSVINGVSDMDKISWLQSSNLIFSYPEYHEVFLLIGSLFSSINDIERNSFLAYLEEVFSHKNDENKGLTDAYLLDYCAHLAYYLNTLLPESEDVIQFYQFAQSITGNICSRTSSPEFPSYGKETEEYFRSEFKTKPLRELIDIASSLTIDLKTEYIAQLLNAIKGETSKALEALEILSESEEPPDINVARVILGSLAANHIETEMEYKKYLELLNTERFFNPAYLSEIYSVHSRANHYCLTYEQLLIELKVCHSFWSGEKSGNLVDTPYAMLDENTALSLMPFILCRIVKESNDSELTSAALQFLEELVNCREVFYLPLFRGLGRSLFVLFECEKNWTESFLIPLFSPSTSSNEVAQELWEGFFSIVNDRDDELKLLETSLIESCQKNLVPMNARNFHQILLKHLFSGHVKELEQAMVHASDDKGLAVFIIHLRYSKQLKNEFQRYWDDWVKEYLVDRLSSRVKPVLSKEFTEILLYAIEFPRVYEDLSDLLSGYTGLYEKRAVDFVKACRTSGFHHKNSILVSELLIKMVSVEEYSLHKTGKVVVSFVDELLSSAPEEFTKLLPILELYGMAGVPESRIVYQKFFPSDTDGCAK